MNINYKNGNIVDCEIIDNKEVITVICPKCGHVWRLSEEDINQPYAYAVCAHCDEPIFLS